MLLRGCHKRVICLRGGGSHYFDEAFFILRPDAAGCEADILAEAEKIAKSTVLPRARRKAPRAWLARTAFFLFGALCASLVWFITLMG